MTTMLAFFGLGTQEVVLIGLIVLLLFGAKKLPELARGLGKSLGEFKKAKKELEEELTNVQDDLEKSVKEEPGTPAGNNNPYTVDQTKKDGGENNVPPAPGA